MLAQRLVRKICAACREPYAADRKTAALLGGDAMLFRGRGCPECRGTGYSGRSGVFELLVMTDDIREALVSHPSRRQLEELASAAGLRTLIVDGWDKVKAGITTTEEVLRVTQQ